MRESPSRRCASLSPSRSSSSRAPGESAGRRRRAGQRSETARVRNKRGGGRRAHLAFPSSSTLAGSSSLGRHAHRLPSWRCVPSVAQRRADPPLLASSQRSPDPDPDLASTAPRRVRSTCRGTTNRRSDSTASRPTARCPGRWRSCESPTQFRRRASRASHQLLPRSRRVMRARRSTLGRGARSAAKGCSGGWTVRRGFLQVFLKRSRADALYTQCGATAPNVSNTSRRAS